MNEEQKDRWRKAWKTSAKYWRWLAMFRERQYAEVYGEWESLRDKVAEHEEKYNTLLDTLARVSDAHVDQLLKRQDLEKKVRRLERENPHLSELKRRLDDLEKAVAEIDEWQGITNKTIDVMLITQQGYASWLGDLEEKYGE